MFSKFPKGEKGIHIGGEVAMLDSEGIGNLRGDLLCWKFIELLKFQITNIKYQANNNDRNSKIQTPPY